MTSCMQMMSGLWASITSRQTSRLSSHVHPGFLESSGSPVMRMLQVMIRWVPFSCASRLRPFAAALEGNVPATASNAVKAVIINDLFLNMFMIGTIIYSLVPEVCSGFLEFLADLGNIYLGYRHAFLQCDSCRPSGSLSHSHASGHHSGGSHGLVGH